MPNDDTLPETILAAPHHRPAPRVISPPEETTPLTPGQRIQSSITYELDSKIGTGGMGEVYKANLLTNLGTSEQVALKKIRTDLALSQGEDPQEMLERFRRETSIIAELNGHPNIVGFRGADIMEGSTHAKDLYFVMEYVHGFDLKQFMALHRITNKNIAAGKALMIPNEFVGFILFRVANALHHAHTFRFSNGSRGIAHLDLSPGNILINSQFGLIKISDFGIASNLEDLRLKIAKGYFLGKPTYMAPELILQNRANTADFTVDFYSLGVIIYQLLTGINPNRIPGFNLVRKEKIADTIAEFQKRPLIPPHQIAKGVDEAISAIVMTMMEYKRENRYSSARKIRDIIGQAIYKRGYGPTDHSFALYLTKLKMLQMVHMQKDPMGNLEMRRLGRREYDHKMLEVVEVFEDEAEPLWLHGDAISQLADGKNPCRA
ncbi:MAG: serine/threonine protein kinase [Magnetococcales bacterium]|nr:serine/threonine protein kinase [Magnetococcales bacterium]